MTMATIASESYFEGMSRFRSLAASIASIAPIASILVASFALQGCVSFRSGDVASVPPSGGPAPADAPPINYDFTFLSRGTPNAAVTNIVQPIVERELKASGSFKETHVGNDGDPHVKITVNNTGPIGAALITGIFSGLTLTVLPGYARDNYMFNAVVTKNGTEVKRYHYEDGITTWTELLLIFGMPFNDSNKEKVEEIVADMTQNLAHDLKADGLLK